MKKKVFKNRDLMHTEGTVDYYECVVCVLGLLIIGYII